MPPKAATKAPAGAKKNAKELEAEAKEEEKRAILNSVKEQNQQYGVLQLFPGLELLITEFMVETTWDHDAPVHHLKECIFYQLERIGISQQFKVTELETLGNMLVYALIFAKKELSVSNYKASVIVNLMWNLLKFNDSRFTGAEIPIWSESKFSEVEDVENLEEWAAQNVPKKFSVVLPSEESESDPENSKGPQNFTEGKSYANDLSNFKTQVKELSKVRVAGSDKNFTPEELGKVIEYSFQLYFEKWDLFDYYVKYQQSEEEIYLKVTIDMPQVPGPLENANYLGKIILDDERQKLEEDMRQAAEEQQRVAEREKAERDALKREEDERWAGLDEKTIQMIKDKISETRDYMEKELQSRKEEYAEKISNAKNSKGKKK